MDAEWQIENAFAILGKFRKFAKKHPHEYASLFTNLDKIQRILAGGHNIGGFSVGFFRSEGEGVYRIGQTGVRSAKESRLYVYPDEQDRLIYVLTLGDKDSQGSDINESKKLVRQIKQSRVHEDEHD